MRLLRIEICSNKCDSRTGSKLKSLMNSSSADREKSWCHRVRVRIWCRMNFDQGNRPRKISNSNFEVTWWSITDGLSSKKCNHLVHVQPQSGSAFKFFLLADKQKYLHEPILSVYQPIRTENKTVHSRTTVVHTKLDFDENTSFEYKLQIWKNVLFGNQGKTSYCVWQNMRYCSTDTYQEHHRYNINDISEKICWRHFKMVSALRCWWRIFAKSQAKRSASNI